MLADVVNTTTPVALLKHDLAEDLSSRCRRATNQVLEYMNTRDPIPDNFEMADLLATHEVLEQSLHHYHRTVLEARKSSGIGELRRDADGKVPVEMTPAGKGKANAQASSPAPPAMATATAGTGGTHPSGSSGNSINYDGPIGRPKSPRSGDEAFDRNEDNDLIAAAIAASKAPGSNARPVHGAYQAGGGGSSSAANEVDNPFADNAPESSHSSSRVRPSYGGGSGSGSGVNGKSSAGAGARSWSYVDSENESDEEYLRVRRRNKAAVEAGGSSSSAAGGGGSSTAQHASRSSTPLSTPAVPLVTTRPSPAVDAEAQERGSTVYRY